MRLAGLPIVMSLALLAAPAFAQSGTTATAPNQSSSMSSSSNMNSGSNSSRDQGVTMDTQQKIRHSLEQNGFKNVQVVPQSFVIRAMAPDGSRLVMEVSPDQFEEVVAPPVRSGSNAGSRSGSNLGNNSSGNNTSGSSSMSGSSPSNSSSTGNSLNDNSPSSNSSSSGMSR